MSLSISAAIVIMVVTWIPGNPADTFWLSVVGSGPFVLLQALKIAAAYSLFLMAALLYGQPKKSEKWGKYALVASIVSIASSSLGGLGLGAAIGIAAGLSAILWGGQRIERELAFRPSFERTTLRTIRRAMLPPPPHEQESRRSTTKMTVINEGLIDHTPLLPDILLLWNRHLMPFAHLFEPRSIARMKTSFFGFLGLIRPRAGDLGSRTTDASLTVLSPLHFRIQR